MPQNLEQVRAASALNFWNRNPDGNHGDDDGKVVERLPALLINNGLLATAAFCRSKSDRDEKTKKRIPGSHEKILHDVFEHIAESLPAALSLPTGFEAGEENDFDRFLRALTQGNSAQIQESTAEALAYLGYLKRFAR